MRQMFPGRSGRRSGLLASIVLMLALLAACGRNQPAPTAEPAATATGQAELVLEAPQPGQTIGSPFELRGQINPAPDDGSLVYRVIDAGGNVVGSGTFQVAVTGEGAAFATQGIYVAADGGAGQVEVFQSSSNQALATVSVNLTPNQGGAVSPTELPTSVATGQAITIDTPAPGTVVGSPVVITGRTAQFPFQGVLSYRITDQGGTQVGSGSFNVVGAAGAPTTFTASLTFNEPASGGTIRVEIFDQNPTSGAVVATAAIDLTVAPRQPTAQQIVIDSPPPGTVVGNPVVLTGRTARFPFQGALSYRVIAASGALLGSGVFPVNGQPNQPSTFAASIEFELPPQGGPIRVELLDQNAANGQVAATAAINLVASPAQPPGPPPQQITILSPPGGTLVGSPVVVTGQTTRFPFEGNLRYRVLDESGNQIGSGSITVNGQAGGPATFNSQVFFTEPNSAGRITVEIFDQDAGNGAIIASASVNLRFEPPQGQQPTSPADPQQPAGPQVITIESPSAGTIVGSPVVITGRSTRLPGGNQLFYQVLDPNQQQLGRGAFNVAPQPDGTARFNASIPFNEPPAGGPISVVILDQDAAGQAIARAAINLVVAPPPAEPSPTPSQPGPPVEPSPTPSQPGPPAEPSPTPSQPDPPVEPSPTPSQPAPPPTEAVPPVITIEAPEPDTAVTSPFTLTGRVSQLPFENNLAYRVYDGEQNVIGEGSITVDDSGGAAIAFEARIEFAEQPADTVITVEIYEEDMATGEKIASASIELRVAGPQPR